ncbi:MAG: hypothetical protein HQL74_11415 [Magnetococcales bacterium]|nr:hypothetical protein [Magnetococcales bacterium]
MSEASSNSQQHAQAGNQAIIIQVGRDAGAIVVGTADPTLRLDPQDQPLDVPSEDIKRLIPYYRFLDCIGREPWLLRLKDWLHAPKPLSVRTIIGGGGRGKTRLAMELCRKVEKEWHAGFVRDSALKRLYDHHDPVSWLWPGPTLVVVDYAASQTNLLRRWLLALKNSGSNNTPALRILLLERHGHTGGGWWNTLFHQGGWDD